MDRDTLKANIAKLYENGVDDEAVQAYIKANPVGSEATVAREAGIAARGAYPVAGGALTGAAIGSLAGPPGIAAGALVGGLAVPLADAGTSVYNAGARAVGFPNAQIGMPSEAIEKFMTNKMGLPEPESTGERAVQAAGGALSGAGTQVPAFAGLARSAATPIVRRVSSEMAAAPKTQMVAAPVSAAVGQEVSEKTDSPALGSLAGAASTVPVALAGSMRMRPQLPPAAPRADVAAASARSYRAAEQAGVVVDEAPFEQLVNTIEPRINNDRFDHVLHPNTGRILERLHEEAGNGPITLERLETLRRIAQSGRQIARRAGNNDDARMAGSIVRDIDGFVNGLDQTQLVAGDHTVAVPALRQARELWRRNAKMHTIETILDTSDDLADPNIIKQRFRSLVKDRDELAQFTPAEQRSIRSVARTGALEAFGKLSPSTDLFGMVKGAGWIGAGLAHPATAVIPLAAIAAKRGANALREREVNNLQNTISRGQPDLSLYDRMYARRPLRMIGQVSDPTALRAPLYTVDDEKGDPAK